MSSDHLEGKAKNGTGRVKHAAADAATELRGDINDALDTAQDQLAKRAAKARAMIGDATDRATDAYEELRDRAQMVADTVAPFVKQRPYASLAIMGVVGLVLGVLFFGRGPKVIYVKPHVQT
jgi:ElaB/YqjD/DUF883 family membrane-anchored ribosome-binding protein